MGLVCDMSSINTRPTFQYSQPDEYRFSHDSVFLAQFVFDRVKGRLSPEYAVLDLCAGCGIVGLDFMFHSQKELGFVPGQFDFLEVQEIYRSHFDQNVNRLGEVDSKMRFLNANYSDLLNAHASQYDLILCNPPYFLKNEGTLSPSDFKNRCRFFIDSDIETLVRSITYVLKPGGEAYLLLREEKLLARIASLLVQNEVAQLVGDIRGTPLVIISKT